MKLSDISLFAMNPDKSRFTELINECDYYAVPLPVSNPTQTRYFMLFSGNVKTNIRVIRAEEFEHFLKTHKIIIQNGNSLAINWGAE